MLTRCDANFTMLSSLQGSSLILVIMASKTGAYFWSLSSLFDIKKNVFVRTGASVPYPVQMHKMVYAVVTSAGMMFVQCYPEHVLHRQSH